MAVEAHEIEARHERRARLTVVERPKFSPVPHAILMNNDLTRDARLLYGILQAKWWRTGECRASHEELSEAMGTGGKALSSRQLRRYLDELINAKLITETRRGHGQAKAYAPVHEDAKGDTGVSFNKTPVSPLEPNKTPVSDQQDTGVSFNKTPVSDPYKKTGSKKISPKEIDTGDAPRSAERAPTLSGTLIDLVRAGGAPITMRPQDHKALKDSGADPSLVAEAYCAIFSGTWGDEFCRRNLSVQFVIGRLAGYQATKANGPARRTVSGVTNPTLGSNGKRRHVEVRKF